ncbi:MAG: flavodoxin-dependent (E)-4-hydroxy-3-methylbut-2-enyl-diphosphate synthase, partial [Dehalococcoidia bacterium]
AQRVEEHFTRLGKPLTVAVMGCVVNGPGEARMADLGIAGGKGRGVIFRKGQVVRTVHEKDLLAALIEEGDKVVAEMEGAPASPPDEALIPLEELPAKGGA